MMNRPYESDSNFYKVWANMKNRCLSKNHPLYKFYGERGITVCKEWLAFKSFKTDMHESYLSFFESGLKPTLDRTNNEKGYYKENCRWITIQEQQKNRRDRKVWNVNPNSMRQKAIQLGLNYDTVRKRKYLGWPEDRIYFVVKK